MDLGAGVRWMNGLGHNRTRSESMCPYRHNDKCNRGCRGFQCLHRDETRTEEQRLRAELAGAKQSLMLAEFRAQNADRAAIAAATAEWRAAGAAALSAMDDAKRLLKVAGLTMEGGTISEPYNAAAERLRVLVGPNDQHKRGAVGDSA